MRKAQKYFLLLAFAFFPNIPVVFAGSITTKDTLENGLIVLTQQIPSSSMVSVYALVKIGSATEGEYLGGGISHFVEHMLFKGTTKRGVGEITKEIKALGGLINASTGFDHTIYYIDLPAEYYRSAIEIMADMLMHSRFDSAEVDKEREVIFGEMRLRNDDPGVILNELAYQTIYMRHPYRHPIIGYKPLFAKVTRDQLYHFYRRYYIPNNIVLAVTGNIKTAEILSSVQEAFKDFSPQFYPVRHLPAEPPQISPRRVEAEYPTDITRMLVSFRGVSMSHPDMFALDVLAMILGQGRSSRLFEDLLEQKRLVYSVHAVNDTPLDEGFFTVMCSLDKKNISQVLDTIKVQIDQIKKKGIRAQELEKARRQVLSDYLFDRQTSSDVAYDLILNEALIGDYEFSEKYLEGINAVTLEDIKAVARKYLRESTKTTAILKPRQERTKHVNGTDQPKVREIEKQTLDNGLRILLKEDHTFPIVTIQLALAGGLLLENRENNGISNLTASLWIKGTSSRSHLDIAQAVESKGASVSGFSGQNSFGLSLNLLSQDIDFAIELLADLVFNPTFPEAELAKLKEQVQAAILAQQDDVLYVTSRAVKQTLFTHHPYKMDPLGTKESLSRIHREDIVQFYKKFSSSHNMVLAIYGDIDSKKVLTAVRQSFAQLQKKEIPVVRHQEKPFEESVVKTQSIDKEQAVVMLGFRAAPLGSPEEDGLSILTSLLAGGMNSRLFLKVREETGKAYHLGGKYIPGPDMGLLTFYVATMDEDVGKVKKILLDQLQEIQDNPVREEELAEVKTYLKGSQLRSIETNAGLASLTALEELYGVGFNRYKQYSQRIDLVTKEDIQRLARYYLDADKAAMVITRGIKDAEENKQILSGHPEGD